MLKIDGLRRAVLVVSTFALALAGPVGGLSGLAAAAAPGTAAALTGTASPIAHDPTMVKEGDFYYEVITGDSGVPNSYLPMWRSRDLIHWDKLAPVFSSPPQWVLDTLGVPSLPDLWAPELNRVNGEWHLYYAASQFGTLNSVIGLATTKTLDQSSPDYGWVDHGLVLRSQTGEAYNAIDPDYVTDRQGGAWLAYGSFYGGIDLRRLDRANGKLSTTDTTSHPLAFRPNKPLGNDAVEGASITRLGNYFYLFVAFDYCCRGANSDYRVMVGRSTSVTGPYVDKNGVDMINGGGTEVLRGYNEFAGTGGADVFREGSTFWFVHHYYDVDDNGIPKLSVRKLLWHGGWPVVSDPLTPSRDIGHGDAYVKLVNRATNKVVDNDTCGIEAANVVASANRASTCQEWQWISRGEGYNEILNHFSNKAAEVAACVQGDGANVAQWGWLGFLPNNDCQRWRSTAADDGWVNIETKTDGRLLTTDPCSAAGSNVVVSARTDALCQQFRFTPVGDVLLADPLSHTDTLGVTGCSVSNPQGTGVANQARDATACQSWRFSHNTEGYYTVVNASTHLRLAIPDCTTGGTALRAVPSSSVRAGCRQWTLLSNNDGTFALSTRASGTGPSIKLLIP